MSWARWGRIFSSGLIAGCRSVRAAWVVVEQSGVMRGSFSPWTNSSGRFTRFGRPALTYFVALACAHQRNDGGEALRPQSGEVERTGSSVAEAGQVDSIAVDVVALEDVVQDGVEAAGDLRRPPVSGGLRIKHEVIGIGDDVLGGVHAIDGETGATAQVDEQRRWPILTVGERNAQQVRDCAILFRCSCHFEHGAKLCGRWRRGKRAAAFVG